jgi:hypothetical protein
VGSLWRDICENCDLGISTLTTLVSSSLPGGRNRLRKMLGERVKRITVKPFMDLHTMIEERLLQCCVHVATRREDAPEPQHQCAPFCAVQAWPALSAQRLPRATRTLLPLSPRAPVDGVAAPAAPAPAASAPAATAPAPTATEEVTL